MTVVKLNLKGNQFKTVAEGCRNLQITKVEVVPSGRPTQMKLYMKDIDDENASLINTYNFDNPTSVWAMGMMLSAALGLEDGDEFDTKEASQLVGIVLNCDVVHSEYNGKTYANVKKVNTRVDIETAEDMATTVSSSNDLD